MRGPRQQRGTVGRSANRLDPGTSAFAVDQRAMPIHSLRFAPDLRSRAAASRSPAAGVPAGGRVSQADSPRSRKPGGAIHRVDFRPCVLEVRITRDVWCRLTDDVAKSLLVDAGAAGDEWRPVSRPQRPRPLAGMPVAGEHVRTQRPALAWRDSSTDAAQPAKQIRWELTPSQNVNFTAN